MADIDSRMEANGLPTKFESTSENPSTDHTATNLASTVSNSTAAPTSDLKQPPPVPLESSSLVQPVLSTETSIVPDSQPAMEETEKPHINGNGIAEKAPVMNGHTSSPVPEPAVVVQETPKESQSTETVVPSSIPPEVPSSITTNEAVNQVSTIMTEPPVVPEAPVSDLRTTPHADALSPEDVAKIEEAKHEEDEQAGTTAAPTISSPAAPATIPVQANADSALPTPPIQSPPGAPEMEHAKLPSPVPVAEAISVPVAKEEPVEPAPTPIVTAPATAPASQDIVMEDAADVPIVKTAREREEDNDAEEPAAKRVRTDDNTPVSETAEFKVPDAPAASAATNSAQAPVLPVNKSKSAPDGNESVTAPRSAHMKKVISNLKKSNASSAFRLPVDHVALNIPNYPTIVTNPMDLGTIDNKLKNNTYQRVSDFVTDFETIVHNCILFNGREHGVTQQAFRMQNSFNNQMAQLPPAAMQEPTKAEKKAMKLKTEPMRQAPPRRPSVTTPVSAKSPKAAPSASTPAFAPGPDGVPLIRRDSSLADGRPKRAIVPPKRNSDFAGVRPKKKKYELQLRFCQEVLKEIANTKHWQFNQYFTHPVDPVALNIPTYFNVIKRPMDLGTIQTKLDTNAYEKAKDFEEDVRLIFKNCYKFNPDGDFVNQKGHELEELFNRKWAQKDDWIAAREPPSEPSEAEENEEEEEASEDETDGEDDRNEKIKALQAQIEAMSKQMGELTQVKKKKKTPPTATKKGTKTKTKKEKTSATFPGLSKTKDKKKSTSKAKAEKERYVTFAEKQYISNGIAMLPERQMQEALKIIQNSVPSLANSDQNEIELDIEEVPNGALIKLLSFVKKYAGPPPDEPETRAAEVYAAPGVERGKKSKPMSKSEQEAQIAELKGKLGAYGGPVSPDAVPSVETGGDSSDESADSEESEEE